MFNFLKKAGIGSIRILYSVSNKAMKIGLGISIFVLAVPYVFVTPLVHKMKTITKLRASSKMDAAEMDTDFGYASLTLFKTYQKILLQLETDATGDFAFGLVKHTTNDFNNPFALAKLNNEKTSKKVEIFFESSLSVTLMFGLVFLSTYFFMGPYVLDYICLGYLSYPRFFVHCLNSIGFIRNISKNLLVAFELDNTKLLQHFLNKDMPKLEKTLTVEKCTVLELDRLVNIVDYYLLPGTRTPSIPYSNEELLYLRKLYNFAAASDMRIHEDNILRKVINESARLPEVLNNLIISYTNDFGVGKYDYSQNPKKYIADPKVLEFRDAELKLLSEKNKPKEGVKRKGVKI